MPSKAGKKEWRCKVVRIAECDTCGWTLESANADGVGAQHARRLGHYVRVESTFVKLYDHTGGGG